MSPLAQAIILLTAKYGPKLVESIIEVAHRPAPTRADWKAVFAEAQALDYNQELQAAEQRAASKQ